MALATVKQYIRQLVNGTTVKYSNRASAGETTSSSQAFDAYLKAYYQNDTFYSYSTYPYAVLEQCPGIVGHCQSLAESGGLSYSNQMTSFALYPDQIPNTIKPSDTSKYKDIYDEVLQKYRQYVLDNYVEQNPYYRTLFGLPGSNEIIYVNKSVLERYEIDYTKYEILNDRIAIHLLDDADILILESAGYLDILRTQNPTFKYLNYLGINRIDIVIAHQAKNFSILKIDKMDIPENIYTSFTRIYEQCRSYFMSAIYNRQMSSVYEQYDNFMGLCIMIMTIQRFVSSMFKFGIQRDLYDWEFIQNLYNSYNVPFIETLSMEHHIVLIKNLNNLLRHKSTDKVLLDICSLLGLTYADIYKYYLVKQQLRDDNGDPIFIYKEGTDNEIDYEATFDLYFQAVNIEEENVILALQSSTDGNRVDYEEMVNKDPYWWEDDELKELKYKTAFNYIETKYLSLNLMYKMTEMLFEVSYAFRLILDKKDDLHNYKFSIPKIIPNIQFEVFDIVVFMIALMCKQYGFRGNIINDPGFVAHIYGFDFTAKDTDEYKRLLNSLDDKDEDSKTLKQYLTDINITGDIDVSKLFDKIREYNKFMSDKMRDMSDIHTYHLYRDIFNITMTEDNMKSIFTYTDSEGEDTIAESYKDYLYHKVPLLFNIVDTVEKEDIPGYMEHLISQLDVYIEELQYTHIVTGTDSPLITALVSLIQFFKSYTVDIAGFNIIYLFDSKIYNMVKLYEYIKCMKVNMQLPDSTNQHYADNVHIDSKSQYDDIHKITDMIKLIHSNITPKESFKKFEDFVSDITSDVRLYEDVNLLYSDDIGLESDIKNTERIGFAEKLIMNYE